MIKKIGRVILVGTSHVAKKSKNDIKQAIETYNPDVVSLELDYARFKRLHAKPSTKKQKTNYIQTMRSIGVSGFLFGMLASYVQKKVGHDLGIEPGVDMKSAYKLARNNKIPTALIDIDINVTLRKLSRLSFTRKIKLFGSLFFKSMKKEHRQKLNFDLKSVPPDHLVQELIGILEKEVPDLYKILIEDRNHHMSKRLMDLLSKHEGNIVAVVGAGHVDGMMKILQKKMFEEESTYSFSFTTDIENNDKLEFSN